MEEEKEYRKTTPWKVGDEVLVVQVRFPGNAKSQTFALGKAAFAHGQTVVAMSDRGLALGYINSFPYNINFDESLDPPLSTIVREATKEDIDLQKEQTVKEHNAEKACLDFIDQYKLDMNLTHVEYIQFGKKAVFYFTAPARVDFRMLVKDLLRTLRVRIELRQISVRDRTAALGGIGACGLQTCCSSFLASYGQVNIKMAKNQNLALIPSKMNGVCGQIKCCIKYEDEVYTEKRQVLPMQGSFIKTKNGDIGKVEKLNILQQEFEMLTKEGKRRRYISSQYNSNYQPSKIHEFSYKDFNHIVNETNSIIK